jgi:poly-gamma-glutamate synthase PgsB/CapB
MIPVRGVLITAERRHLGILAEAAADRGTRLVSVTEEEVAAITDAEMAAFGYIEHKENVALALRVLTEVGVGRAVGLAGMQRAAPDPGALTVCALDFFGRQIFFYNAFAANDPQSTATIWELVRARHREVRRTIAVFNLRADRPSRTMQLAEATYWRDADRVVLMGTGAYLFARVAARSGADVARFVFAEQQRVEEVFETIIDLCGPCNLIVGMANIGGQGLALVRLFRNRAKLTREEN